MDLELLSNLGDGTRHIVGDVQLALGELTIDENYATGGLALDFDPTFLITGQGITDLVFASPTDGFVFSYDYTNKKLLAFQQTDPADAGGADIPLVEVANSTALDMSVRVMAYGR